MCVALAYRLAAMGEFWHGTGYVAIYAVGTSAVRVLLGDEGLEVTRMHRESRSVVENIEKLLT